MRIIGKITKEKEVERFSLFLRKEKIEHVVESKWDEENKSPVFEIWIYNEDELDRAFGFFQEFIQDPKGARFSTSGKDHSIPQEEKVVEAELQKIEKNLFFGKMTFFFLGLCSLFYLIQVFQEYRLPKSDASELVLTPIEIAFLYDYTPQMEALSSFASQHSLDPSKKWEEQPPEVQEGLQKINAMPSWRGFYFQWLSPQKEATKPPLFTKIREKEVWRIFTPSFMHVSFFHILFNMLWLLALGKQIEKRIRGFRFFLLVIILSGVSNTAQYLMGGPLFFGFSGVVTGLAGFIFERQRIAPWEGYPLPKLAIGFLGFYIILLMVLEFFLFGVQLMGLGPFSSKIANTAHITGAICGILIAKIPYFGEKSFES